MLRTYTGDNVRLRLHAGGHEEEHNVTLHGVKWLQNGSGFGNSSNSGWKSSQMIGISEQMGFMAPVSMISSSAATNGDYLYSMDAALEGYWNGIWGVMRNYTAQRADLFALPNNPQPVAMRNTVNFDGICPKTTANPNGIGTRPTVKRNYEIVAALANDILENRNGVSINDPAGIGQHVGGALKANGGTLVFNSRRTASRWSVGSTLKMASPSPSAATARRCMTRPRSCTCARPTSTRHRQAQGRRAGGAAGAARQRRRLHQHHPGKPPAAGDAGPAEHCRDAERGQA
jgi:hypothetical protein